MPHASVHLHLGCSPRATPAHLHPLLPAAISIFPSPVILGADIKLLTGPSSPFAGFLIQMLRPGHDQLRILDHARETVLAQNSHRFPPSRVALLTKGS